MVAIASRRQRTTLEVIQVLVMRKFLCVGLILAAAQAVHGQANPTFHLPMNEGSGNVLYDIAQWQQPARLSGTPTWGAGAVGQGLLVSGDEQIRLSGAALEASQAGTYSLWLKADGARSERQFVLGGQRGGNTNRYLIVGESHGLLGFYCQTNATTNTPHLLVWTSLVPTAAPVHVVVSFDETETRVYADGSLLKTAGGCGNLADPHLATVLGGHPSRDPDRGFAGLLDDVRIFDRVLSAAEVTTLHADSLVLASSGDHVPPVFSQSQAQRASSTSATVSVSTDEQTRLRVELGPGASPSIPAAWNPVAGTSHLQTIPNLTGDDAFTFRLWAVDDAGNVAAETVAISGDTDPGLLLHLPFEEGEGSSAIDSTGNFSALNITGSPAWAEGMTGDALVVSGSESIDVPASLIANSGQGAYSLWVNLEDASPWRGSLIEELVGPGNSSWNLRLNEYTGWPEVYFQAGQEDPTSPLFVRAEVQGWGGWIHLAVSFDPRSTEIFVNGALAAVGPGGSSSQSPLGILRIGEDMEGVLDEIRVFDRPLDVSEVEDLYYDCNLVFHAPLNEGSGDLVFDVAGTLPPAEIPGAHSWQPGVFDGGLSLDDPAGLATPAIRFEQSFVGRTGFGAYSLWFQANAQTSFDRILLREMVGGGNGSWSLRLLENTGFLRIYSQRNNDNPSLPLFLTDAVNYVGAWHHAVVSFEPHRTRLFVDGALRLDGPGGSANQPLAGAIQLGSGFVGQMDEVRIYDRPLRLSKVEEIFSAGPPPGGTDTTPPVLSQLEVLNLEAFPLTGVEGTINVSADEPVRLFVEVRESLGGTVWSQGLTPLGTSFSLPVSELDFATDHELLVWAVDPSGNLTEALPLAFTTPPRPPFVYASPDGLPSARGSLLDPVDLDTATNGQSPLLPGDTLFLHDGLYTSSRGGRWGFAIEAAGTATAPITIRPIHLAPPYPILNHGIFVLGDYVTLMNLESTTTMPRPPSSNTRVENNAVTPHYAGLDNGAIGNRFINCVIHDNYSSNSVGRGAEIYGNVIYHNGRLNSDGLSGHGLYIQNPTSDPVEAVENIIFDSYFTLVHVFGSEGTQLNDVHTIGNVLFRGSYGGHEEDPVLAPRWGSSILYRGGLGGPNGVLIRDNICHSASIAPRQGVDAEISGNTVIDAQIVPLQMQDLEMTNNRMFQVGDLVEHNSVVELRSPDTTANPPNHFFDGNSYQNTAFVVNYIDANNAFQQITFGRSSQAFSDWQDHWQMETTSSYTFAPPTGLEVTVKPNQYEYGRATIVALNWDLATSFDVDVSGVLTPGDPYVIYNVLDLSRDPGAFTGVTPVSSGTYDGSLINLPTLRADPSPNFDVYLMLVTNQ
ncbi:MAG: hypothetical protein K0U98_08695 [Deltaproteobacteria bacterium]|nr:hypothetical protein [Deltaproteobacteria bacterium]